MPAKEPSQSFTMGRIAKDHPVLLGMGGGGGGGGVVDGRS